MDEAPPSTWHFFERETAVDLWCAVQAHQALPAFLLSGRWRFSGQRRGDADAPPGFNRAAASVADRLNGFYLFQRTDRRAP